MKLAIVLAFLAAANAFAGEWEMFERRVGMFVHWGIYSVDGYHEQQRWRQKMPRREYAKRVAGFTAEKFDAESLVKAAESLGAEYIVFTTKHHDGFCMWDTKTTDFNVMNSPARRDIVREVSQACRRRGIKLGFYFSNPDWNHPNGYNKLSTHQTPPEPGDVPDMGVFKEFVKAQITELMTSYGEICCLFWDIPTHIDAPEMNELVRRLQPGIKIDDRGWGEGGDYSTPERGLPVGAAFEKPTEACDSVGARSWGFRVNEDYRTVGYCTRAIDQALSRGGNFLLNVGPKADGSLPDEVLQLLAKTGAWYRRVRESYCKTTTVPWPEKGENVYVTRRGGTVYVHCAHGLDKTGLDLYPLSVLPSKVTVLNDSSNLESELAVMPNRWQEGKKTLHVKGIDAERYAGRSVVLRLDFPEGVDPFMSDAR
jgi:alpha-L-fucosidase